MCFQPLMGHLVRPVRPQDHLIIAFGSARLLTYPILSALSHTTSVLPPSASRPRSA
jgi:hypothetical protein